MASDDTSALRLAQPPLHRFAELKHRNLLRPTVAGRRRVEIGLRNDDVCDIPCRDARTGMLLRANCFAHIAFVMELSFDAAQNWNRVEEGGLSRNRGEQDYESGADPAVRK